MKIRVSVVIPAYNEEKNIGRCLIAIKAQSQKPYEVIVVDNGSFDKTVEIARKYGAKVIHESLRGIIYARNRGFDEAKGDVIARTDADTVVSSDWVERITKNFENRTVNRVAGTCVFYKKWMWPIFNFMVFWANDILGYKALYGPNFAIRRSAWLEARDTMCAESSVHEDLDLAIHMNKSGGYIRDYKITATTSARRTRNPYSFFGKYIAMWVDTVTDKDHAKKSKNIIISHLLG
jgi:glycosyltransferase involved in cell wall biosynthesis